MQTLASCDHACTATVLLARSGLVRQDMATRGQTWQPTQADHGRTDVVTWGFYCVMTAHWGNFQKLGNESDEAKVIFEIDLRRDRKF
jgi:hypothetical protein